MLVTSWKEIMTSWLVFQSTFILRWPRVADFTYIIKIGIIFMNTTFWPPHPWVAPKNPILNRVKDVPFCKILDDAQYNSCKKKVWNHSSSDVHRGHCVSFERFLLKIKIFKIFKIFNHLNPNVGVGGWGCPPSWFSLNNSKTVKAVSLEFSAFSNILLQTIVPNLVSIPRPCLQSFGETQTGYFRFPDFWSIPYKRKLS